MARLISAIELTEELWHEETIDGTATLVKYLPLAKSDAGNVLLMRDVAIPKRMNATNSAIYIDCEADGWMNDAEAGYLARLSPAMRAHILTSTVKVKPYGSDEITEIARQVFILSASEMGFTGTDIPAEGESILPALKAHRNTTNDYTARICYNDAGAAVYSWLRSASSAGQFRLVYTSGVLYSNNASSTWICLRPAFWVSVDTMVSDQGEDTIYILPDASKLYREAQLTAYVGQAAQRPKLVKVEADITNATEHTVHVSNNAKDAEPVWVPCTLGTPVELTNTTKTTDRWELGVKIYAKNANGGRSKIGEPVVMAVLEEAST